MSVARALPALPGTLAGLENVDECDWEVDRSLGVWPVGPMNGPARGRPPWRGAKKPAALSPGGWDSLPSTPPPPRHAWCASRSRWLGPRGVRSAKVAQAGQAIWQLSRATPPAPAYAPRLTLGARPRSRPARVAVRQCHDFGPREGLPPSSKPGWRRRPLAATAPLYRAADPWPKRSGAGPSGPGRPVTPHRSSCAPRARPLSNGGPTLGARTAPSLGPGNPPRAKRVLTQTSTTGPRLILHVRHCGRTHVHGFQTRAGPPGRVRCRGPPCERALVSLALAP